MSLLGDWFNLIASAALITTLTESGLAIGGLFVVRMLAPFLISPVAGVLADRYDRRTLLILADLSRATTVLGFLIVRQPEQVWLLYVLTAVQLAISGIFFPARNAILPDIVSQRELGAANALSSATWSVMLAVGAALGGLVAGGWGAYPAFIIDALTFLGSAFLIAQIRTREGGLLATEGAQLQEAVGQYLDGIRYLGSQPDILLIALSKGAMGLTVSGAFEVLQVELAEGVFVIGQGGSTGLGLLYMVSGVGTGLGPILARHWTGDRIKALRIGLPVGFGLASLGLVVVAPLTSFGQVLAGSALRALGSGVNWVLSTQLLLLLVPNRVRGRVFASEFALFTLGTATSAGSVGWLLDNTGLGLGGVLRLLALLPLIPLILWSAWLVFGQYREGPLPAAVSGDEVSARPAPAASGTVEFSETPESLPGEKGRAGRAD